MMMIILMIKRKKKNQINLKKELKDLEEAKMLLNKKKMNRIQKRTKTYKTLHLNPLHLHLLFNLLLNLNHLLNNKHPNH